jgi:LytS/YehU family sensor histidine kinase
MVLLPLVDHMLSAERNLREATSAIEISVSAQAGALCLALSDRNARTLAKDARGVLRDIRERLHALYGARGKLHVESSSGSASIVLEIPYDATEGHHR